MRNVTMRKASRHNKPQQGFVLAVVLWSIAALTLITGGIIARINVTLEQSYRMRELAQLERDLMATEQTLLYLLAARGMNAAGLDLGPTDRGPTDRGPTDRGPTDRGPTDRGPTDHGAAPIDPFASTTERANTPTIRFDGSLYPGVGAAGFAIQDAGATFSLQEPNRDYWHRFMARLGVERAVADRWLDQLLDYQDLDTLALLNGAEAERYRELGLPDPPNRFIVSPHELRNLPIAREYPRLTEQLIRLSTAGVGNQANLNTGPPELLQTLYNLSPEDGNRITGYRQQQLITSLMQASTSFGLVFQGGAMSTVWMPTGAVRLMLGDGQGRQKRWITVLFTPNADGQPWVIEYHHPVDFHHRQRELNTADAFSPRFQNEAALPATGWTLYSTFFPNQLPLDR